MSRIQQLAWAFAALFFVVYILTNIPAFNDAEGRNFGLFVINPIDNVVHLLTALLGALAAWKSARWSKWFFIIFGVLYELDAVAGIFQQRGLLDGTVFTQAGGSPSFSTTNILLNLPHVAIATVMILLGLYATRINRAAARA